MSKAIACVLLALASVASGRSAYQFSDGYLDILGGEPTQSFDCAGRPYGYYADVPNGCQIFHICLPIPNEAGDVVDMAQYSFFCGNQTVFSQESLTCAHPRDAFPCEESEALYSVSNGGFGIIPDYDDSGFGRRTGVAEPEGDLGRALDEGVGSRNELPFEEIDNFAEQETTYLPDSGDFLGETTTSYLPDDETRAGSI